MLGGAKPPRPSDTPPMLGGAKAALPLRDGTPCKGQALLIKQKIFILNF